MRFLWQAVCFNTILVVRAIWMAQVGASCMSLSHRLMSISVRWLTMPVAPARIGRSARFGLLCGGF
jgi:hypothetical protein